MLIQVFRKLTVWIVILLSRNRPSGIAFLCFILLISGCGADETINNPVGGRGATDTTPTPTSPHYFPMTLGSRWVYQNPDGSEWTREVANADFLEAHQSAHSFNYNPPIEEGQLDLFKTPLYITTPDRIVRPIKTSEIGHPKPVVDIRYSIGIQMERNNGRFIRRFGFVGFHTYRIRGFERSDFTFLRPPLVPGKTWRVFSIALRGSHNIHNVASEFTHVLEAHLLISAQINEELQTVVTPAGKFEGCLEIEYYETRSVETTEIQSDLIPKEYEEERDLLETKIHETAATEFLKLMPNIPLGTLWLAPGVGPVKIETPNGIAELIDYEIKAAASVQ